MNLHLKNSTLLRKNKSSSINCRFFIYLAILSSILYAPVIFIVLPTILNNINPITTFNAAVVNTTVTNKSDKEQVYNLVWKDVKNTFKTQSDLLYTIKGSGDGAFELGNSLLLGTTQDKLH